LLPIEKCQYSEWLYVIRRGPSGLSERSGDQSITQASFAHASLRRKTLATGTNAPDKQLSCSTSKLRPQVAMQMPSMQLPTPAQRVKPGVMKSVDGKRERSEPLQSAIHHQYRARPDWPGRNYPLGGARNPIPAAISGFDRITVFGGGLSGSAACRSRRWPFPGPRSAQE
jgi:hypothetical protein